MDSGPLPASTPPASGEERLHRLERWLIESGAQADDPGQVLKGISKQLLELGIPLTRTTLHVRALHAERIGVTRIWRKGHKVEEVYFPHGARDDPVYHNSPLKAVYDSREWLVLAVNEETAKRYNIVPDLVELGVTEYVVAPMFFSNGMENAVTWATDRPGGFLAEEIELLRRLLPTLRTVYELRTLHHTFHDVLRMYAGRGPAERILSGQVRRGEVARIESAILFCDMRNFTALTAAMPAENLVTVLNEYFDHVVPHVISRAGEILKYLGDGILAIFPAGEEDEDVASSKAITYSCMAAYEAATAIVEALDARNARRGDDSVPIEPAVSLHYGRLAYGNVGSGERLDFTVIGSAVNLTSRLNELCSVVERPILMSADFAQRIGSDCCVLGSFELKGIEGQTIVHAPE